MQSSPTEQDILDILAKDDVVVSAFQQKRFREQASKMWDSFYKRNTVNFFKDRHWTEQEFPELRSDGTPKVLFEIGCGVGNFLFPILISNPTTFIYACDFSKRAVDFVIANEAYTAERCKAFVCDITCDSIEQSIPTKSVDICSAMFVLSAIPPEKMDDAVQNIKSVMKADGVILIRDYGQYDCAQLRFKKGHKCQENLYVRQDGTFSYYFTTEFIQELFARNGFDVLENGYIRKTVLNRKEATRMDRIFVQSKFRLRE